MNWWQKLIAAGLLVGAATACILVPALGLAVGPVAVGVLYAAGGVSVLVAGSQVYESVRSRFYPQQPNYNDPDFNNTERLEEVVDYGDHENLAEKVKAQNILIAKLRKDREDLRNELLSQVADDEPSPESAGEYTSPISQISQRADTELRQRSTQSRQVQKNHH